MKLKTLLLLGVLCLLTLTACTTQEKRIVKDLEDMPGLTCDIGNDGQTHCHPDKVPSEQNL